MSSDASIQPSPIHIDQSQLDDLKQRLQMTRWPDHEPVSDWSQGTPLNYMIELCNYWRSEYDWRRCEAKLNSFNPCKTVIDGLGIHFLHVRSRHAHAKPLIMTHGWPGSIVEFHKVIGPLTDPTAFGGDEKDAFHVVCPSLPGYGFSDQPTETGWNLQKIGRAWGQLMARLGYDSYFAQGGDWGSAVTHSIAHTESDHCLAIHTNMPLVKPDPDTMNDLLPIEEKALAGMQFYEQWDSGYSKQQATRPQTVGYGLADSPAGQAAWIVEKLMAWSDCGDKHDKHPENVFSKDEMLDNIMMYWLPNAGASSARLYWESFSTFFSDPIEIPVGCSVFPKELFLTSRRWAEKQYHQLIHFNEVERGGHFAAFEQPELFVREIRDCFRSLRQD